MDKITVTINDRTIEIEPRTWDVLLLALEMLNVPHTVPLDAFTRAQVAEAQIAVAGLGLMTRRPDLLPSGQTVEPLR